MKIKLFCIYLPFRRKFWNVDSYMLPDILWNHLLSIGIMRPGDALPSLNITSLGELLQFGHLFGHCGWDIFWNFIFLYPFFSTWAFLYLETNVLEFFSQRAQIKRTIDLESEDLVSISGSATNKFCDFGRLIYFFFCP